MPTLDVSEMVAVRKLSRRSKLRRGFLAAHMDRPISSSLEIGALNVPTLLPDECDVNFLDWFSTEELRTRHRDNEVVPPDTIMPIDFVVSDSHFADAVDRKFDLLIANHVIEHIPNIIGWFDQLGQLAEPDAYICLAVPDRRYTFDYFRPEDDAVDIVRAHADGLERPSKFQIAKHLYYFTNVTHKEIWAGDAPTTFTPRMTFAEALEKSEVLAEKYADVHCWVFTRSTFERTMAALVDGGHIDWKIVAIEGVNEGENEFRVLLERANNG